MTTSFDDKLRALCIAAGDMANAITAHLPTDGQQMLRGAVATGAPFELRMTLSPVPRIVVFLAGEEIGSYGIDRRNLS